jgi:hypothetical protein
VIMTKREVQVYTRTEKSERVRGGGSNELWTNERAVLTQTTYGRMYVAVFGLAW